jgi:uncharacterized protein YndB with AHSA1/START domain
MSRAIPSLPTRYTDRYTSASERLRRPKHDCPQSIRASTDHESQRLMAGPVTESIGIAKPPEAVWNLLTTADQIADWYDDWDAVDCSRPGESIRAGSTFRLSRRSNSAWCRVVVAEPPHRLQWLEVTNDGFAVSVEFCVSPDEVGGTVLTHTKTVIRHGTVAAHLRRE